MNIPHYCCLFQDNLTVFNIGYHNDEEIRLQLADTSAGRTDTRLRPRQVDRGRFFIVKHGRVRSNQCPASDVNSEFLIGLLKPDL